MSLPQTEITAVQMQHFFLLFHYCLNMSLSVVEIVFDYYDTFVVRWQHMNGVL